MREEERVVGVDVREPGLVVGVEVHDQEEELVVGVDVLPAYDPSQAHFRGTRARCAADSEGVTLCQRSRGWRHPCGQVCSGVGTRHQGAVWAASQRRRGSDHQAQSPIHQRLQND